MSGVVLTVLEMLNSSHRSKSAKGSSGERVGWVSLSPLICVTSAIGSQRILRSA